MGKRRSFFQRRYFRIPFEDLVEFSILKFRHSNIAHLSAKKGQGSGHDLGEDGLSFTSSYCLPVDMVLRVVFSIPSGEKRVLARVVRSCPNDHGFLTAVQYINMHGTRREELRHFIALETKKSYKFLKYI